MNKSLDHFTQRLETKLQQQQAWIASECRCGHAEVKHQLERHADNMVERCMTYKCICGKFEKV